VTGVGRVLDDGGDDGDDGDDEEVDFGEAEAEVDDEAAGAPAFGTEAEPEGAPAGALPAEWVEPPEARVAIRSSRKGPWGGRT